MKNTLSAAVILWAFLILVGTFPARAQKQNVENWGIADYFNNLPEKYKTFSGDFSPPSAETTVIAEANGYAAYMNSPLKSSDADNRFPIFETALFKSQTKSPLIVVSNMKSDSVCTDYETFFLRYDGSVWKEVEREVLPPMNLKMFWDNPQSATRFAKIVERDNSTTYHFEPPRQGTRMRVSLEICDFLEDETPQQKIDELNKLRESAKPIFLDWDKQNGKFIRAK